MSKYYYLIAGLPNIAFDDSKLPYKVLSFKDELRQYLSKQDKYSCDILSLKTDNKNLLKLIKNPGFDLEIGGNLSWEDLNELFTGLKNEEGDEKPYKNRNKQIPPYFATFVRNYNAAPEEAKATILWEDQLATMYYDYAITNATPFVAAWCQLNLHIGNILTALTCRKHNLDRATYVIGQSEVANKLRTSNARDFDLDDTLEYLPAILKIAEEPDLLQRERKIDHLKWTWLDENTFNRVFDIENVLAYLLKLEILDRWATLDKAEGESRFCQLIETMKKGSNNALEEFKRNNKK